MAGLRYILLVIAISPAILAKSVPASQAALNEIALNGTALNKTASNQTCIDRHRSEIANASTKATICLVDYVKYYANDTNNSSCTNVESVKSAAQRFLNSMKPCLIKSKTNYSSKIEAVMEFVEFSLKDANFTAFTKSGGARCIHEAAPGIKQCVIKKIGHNVTKSTFDFTDIVGLSLGKQEGCDITKNMKPCVNSVLRNIKNCTTESIDYVDSLFDFISQKHCKTNSPSSVPATSASVSMLIISSFFMILELITSSS